jgi:hypothetical protein
VLVAGPLVPDPAAPPAAVEEEPVDPVEALDVALLPAEPDEPGVGSSAAQPNADANSKHVPAADLARALCIEIFPKRKK